jgi:asparagine synthetase B (glutamine-hydrolysing)
MLLLWPLCSNSEIYNHEELKEKYLKGVKIVKDSKSDSATVGHLYEVCSSNTPPRKKSF